MSNTPDNNRPSLEVEINVDPKFSNDVDEDSIRAAVIAAAQHRGFHTGEIGVRVTDDSTIRQINMRHLDHDYETDVISFAYTADSPRIEGELVVSIETARDRAAEIHWNATHELLLYVVHGTLHIAGMDDHDDEDRAAMRAAERDVMTELGIADIVRCGVETNS